VTFPCGTDGSHAKLPIPVRPEQHVPGSGSPRPDLAGEGHVYRHLLGRCPDSVVVQVAGEPVRPEPHVSSVACRGPLPGREGQHLLVRAAVRKVEVQAQDRGQRPLRGGQILVHEDHHQRGPIVEVRVEVPPLVGTCPVVGAGPVLPPGDRGRIEPEAGIVGRTTREPRQDLVAGHGGTPQRLRAVPVTGSAADGVRKPGPGCRWRHCGASFIRGHSRLTVQRLQRSRRHERRRNAIQSR
jgi:hypothetical protein